MISTAWALTLTWTLPGLFGGHYGQPSAVLWKNQLFVAMNGMSPTIGGLYRGTVRLDWAGISKPVEYCNPIRGWHAYQAQLEIRDNRVLLSSPGSGHLIFPLLYLPCFDLNGFEQHLSKLHGFQSRSDLLDTYSGTGIGYPLLFPSHRAPDVPAPRVPIQPQLARTPEGVKAWQQKLYTEGPARFSVELVGPKSVRLFHAHKDRLFVSVELDYLNGWYLDGPGTVSKNLPKPPDRELRTGTVPAGFTEYFVAYRAAERDYLVTPNGKVFMAAPKGKTEVDVSAVWADPKRPIAGVVQDLAGDAIYAWGFVTDSAAPERFYVKLSPKPVAVEYQRTVPRWGDRSDAYLESYECTRAFRKAMEKK